MAIARLTSGHELEASDRCTCDTVIGFALWNRPEATSQDVVDHMGVARSHVKQS